MRAFLGIPVTDNLKPKIIKIQDRFSNFDIKLVESKNLHFNLKFFKELENEKVKKLKEILEKISTQFEPFEIEISGIGAFPSKNYIRVIWLGVKQGYPTFRSLAETIENALESLGFEKNGKFIPHLTLGRVRSGRNKNELLILLRKLEDIKIGRMKIDKMTFFQSKLSPKGPIYEEVFSVSI